MNIFYLNGLSYNYTIPQPKSLNDSRFEYLTDTLEKYKKPSTKMQSKAHYLNFARISPAV